MNGFTKAPMGVMRVSMNRTVARRLSFGVTTLALAGIVLLLAAGGASALCNQTANPDTCHGCCYSSWTGSGWVTWCYECGDTAAKQCTLDTDMECSGDGLILGDFQPAVNGNNHYISGDGSGTGIYVPGCQCIPSNGVCNLEVKNFEKGIWFQDGVTDYKVSKCKIHDNAIMGIHLDHLDQRKCEVSDCKIYNNSGEGIYIDNVYIGGSSSSFGMVDNTIYNNTAGIYCEGKGKSEEIDYVLGRGNYVEGNDAGITIAGDNWTLNLNTIRYNEVGINLTGGSEDVTLTGNTVCYNGGMDIYVETSNSAAGANNTCDTTHNYNDTGTVGCTFSCPNRNIGCVGDETGTVYLFGDTVTENCTFNGDMECPPATNGLIVGANNIVIDGAGHKLSGHVACTTSCPGYESNPVVTHSGIVNNGGYDNVTIKDVEIRNVCTGVVIGPTELERMVVTGCKIHDCGHPGSNEKTHGIHIVCADYCNITKNEIYNISGGPMDDCGGGGCGMFIRTHADYNTVTCNRIYDTEKTGIFSKYQCMHNYVGYNRITGCPESGINPMCMMSNYNTFEYNNLSDNIGSGYSTGGIGNTLMYNTAHNNPWGGIGATSGDNTATNNSACGNGYTDINANICDDNTCGSGCGCDWTCNNLTSVYFDFDNDGHYSTTPENCACENALGVGACCNPGLFNASHAVILNASGICWLTPGDDADDCDPSIPGMQEPDLMITEKSERWLSMENKTYNITYTVENIGDTVAGTSDVGMYIDGIFNRTVPTKALAMGEEETKTVGPFTMTGESDTIEVHADNNSAVAESNETNNIRENVFMFVRGCVGATQTFTCGDTVTESCTFNGDMTCDTGHGLVVGAAGITINGAGHTITGNRSDCPWCGDTSPHNTYCGILNTQGDDVAIKNLEVTNFCTGITTTRDNNLIYNCSVHDNGVDATYTHGIALKSSQHTTVDNCNVYNNTGKPVAEPVPGGNGIFLVYCSNYCNITNNTVTNNSVYGIYLYSGSKHCHIFNNSVEANGGSYGGYGRCGGIDLDWAGGSSNYATIEDNTISDNTGPGIIVHNSYNTIRDNVVTGNKNTTSPYLPGYGIYITPDSADADHNTIQDNAVCDNEGTDIYNRGNDNTGDDNTCDTTYRYNDTETTGCTHLCGGHAGVCGDVDGLIGVTTNDGRHIFMYLLYNGAEPFSIDNDTLWAADCDGLCDGITTNDGRHIFMHLLHGEEQYPLNCSC